jgi:hypothetical protein
VGKPQKAVAQAAPQLFEARCLLRPSTISIMKPILGFAAPEAVQTPKFVFLRKYLEFQKRACANAQISSRVMIG